MPDVPKYKKSRIVSGKYKALFFATLALTVNFWAWSLLSPLGTKYASDIGLDPSQLSLLLAAPVIIGALGRVVWGAITDKIGGRKAFALACMLTSIPVFGLIFAQTYLQLLFAATLLGVGGASFVIGIPFLSAWFSPSRRGLVLGLYSMGNAGTALSGFVTPYLVGGIGKESTFLVVGVLLILMSLLFWYKAKESPSWKPSSNSVFDPIKKSLQLRATWDLSAIYVISFGAFVAFGVYLPVLLKVVYDLPLTDAAAKAAGFILLATIARPVGGWLSDRIGGRNLIKISLVITTVLASYLAFQLPLSLPTTTAYLSLAFVLGCTNGAVFALVGRVADTKYMGSMSGIIGAIGGLGGFLPPLIMGVTYQLTNSYSLALALFAISAFAILVFVSHRFGDKATYKKAI